MAKKYIIKRQSQNGNAQENPNDKWGHAIPLEDKRKELDLIAEAQFMRDLYLSYLPGDTDKDQINLYFDRIDQSIKAGEPIKTDDFDPASYPAPDADAPERQYWYHSADVFKERASRHPSLSSGEDVGDTQDNSDVGSSAHDQHSGVETLPSISERTDGEDSQDDWPF
jgi:hypothetical protein